MPNRFAMGVPGYGVVQFKFFQEFIRFQAELARAQEGQVGFITTETAYIDAALNQIVTECLKRPGWDYLLTVEHDMILPNTYVEALMSLDPDKHKIVGGLYFGRAQDDMRTIPGWIRKDGNFDRLSRDEVVAMLDNPGLHKVDAVGTGALAIHRSVLEDWPEDKLNWFKPGHAGVGKGYLGHDLRFCMEAKEQGHTIWCDSRARIGHLGNFVSNAETFLATTDYAARKAEGVRKSKKLTVLEGAG